MKDTASIYKTATAKEEILRLYDKKLASLDIEYQDLNVETSAGSTHIILAGKKENPPIVLLHGINAGAPVTLEVFKNILATHCVYAIDTIGQTTKSCETRLPIKDNSYGNWLKEVMDQLKLDSAPIIGVSYGAFLLQKLIIAAPEKVEKAIFIIPAGFVNGEFFKSMKQITFPMMKFMRTKKDADLVKFMNAFFTDITEDDIRLQSNIFGGVKMDFRQPPLLKKKDVAHFDAPVYAMVADNDIFFPGLKALEKCKKLFSNFKGHLVLKNTKHVPHLAVFPEIEAALKEWLG